MRILAVTNLSPTPRHPTLGTFVDQQIAGLRRVGVKVESMFVNRFEGGMGSYFTIAPELRNRVERFQPDVVHVMYGGVLSERVTNIVKDSPVVVSFCGSDLLGEQLSGFLRRTVSSCGVFASYLAAMRADGVIVKSRNLGEALPAAVDRSKVRTIPNGIDLERFKALDQAECQKKLGWKHNTFHVLFPANHGYTVKRPRLARAAIEVAHKSGLNVEMHPLQGVPHRDVPIWLNASDVVLLTSLHEGSPNVIKEALACDVPVVSVDVGDVRERIGGIEGCHIAMSDPQDLCAKLLLVHTRGKRIAGRERVLSLSLERISLSLRDFYYETLESCLKHGRQGRLKVDLDLLLSLYVSLLAKRRKAKEAAKMSLNC